MCRAGESSKKGKKRSKRQLEAAIAAATREDGPMGGIRISSASSNSIHTDSAQPQDTTEDTQVQKRKSRGKAKLKFVEKGKEIELDHNIRGQPIGENSPQWSSHIGSLAREIVPLSLNKWTDISEDMKKRLWILVQQKFLVDDCYMDETFMAMGKSWRDFKSRRTTKIASLAKEGSLTPRHVGLLKPDNLTSSEWNLFVKKKCSTEFKAISQRFKDMRAKQTFPHTTGRDGYARLEDRMKKESSTPDAVKRSHVWTRGHKRKNGEPINDATREVLRKMDGQPQESTTTTTDNLENDALARALGPEPPGSSIRGLGFGVTKSKLKGQRRVNGTVHRLENIVYELVDEVKSMRYKLFGRNEATSGAGDNDEDVLQVHVSTHSSQHASANAQGVENLDNTSCKLLHWAGTGEVIAEGKIASTDPNSLVHHMPLGPGDWKVWVDQVIIQNVPLYRPTREFFLLEDAIGSTVAWPSRFISLEG